MEQKTKLILVGLIGVSVACFLLFVSTLNSKQQLLRQRDDLKSQNASLNTQINKLQDTFHDYENRINSLNEDLAKAAQDKADLTARYNAAREERDALAEKLQLNMQAPAPEAPQPPDEYWAGILKSNTDLTMQLEDTRNQLKSIQISNEELQRQKAALELDSANLTHERDDLKRQLEYNQKVSDSIAQELVREKNDKGQIQNSFNTLKNENLILTRQLKSLDDKKIALERKVQDLQEHKAEIESRINEMETMLTSKVTEIDELKNKLAASRQNNTGASEAPSGTVELPAIVVRPSQGAAFTKGGASAPSEAAARGRIVAVNRDNNFVVIDLGVTSGVKIGDNFQVYRNGDVIGAIQAIQVRSDIAACDIKRESTPIKIGDTVQ